ncbi:MAG TPA: hypothetical protein VIH98_13710 [Xanthobacteraceae bacterium]
MSSYSKYCREQAADCARRARIASSPEVAASRRTLQERWLKLAQRAENEGKRPVYSTNAALAARSY